MHHLDPFFEQGSFSGQLIAASFSHSIPSKAFFLASSIAWFRPILGQDFISLLALVWPLVS